MINVIIVVTVLFGIVAQIYVAYFFIYKIIKMIKGKPLSQVERSIKSAFIELRKEGITVLEVGIYTEKTFQEKKGIDELYFTTNQINSEQRLKMKLPYNQKRIIFSYDDEKTIHNGFSLNGDRFISKCHALVYDDIIYMFKRFSNDKNSLNEHKESFKNLVRMKLGDDLATKMTGEKMYLNDHAWEAGSRWEKS